MTQAVIFLTTTNAGSTQTWVAPANCTSLDEVHVIGDATDSSGVHAGGWGGGYAKTVNLAITPGASYAFNLGGANSNTQTWFSITGSAPANSAQGALVTPASPPSVQSSGTVGTLLYSGGYSGSGLPQRPYSGGGAAGPHGNGGLGALGVLSDGGASGGAADGGNNGSTSSSTTGAGGAGNRTGLDAGSGATALTPATNGSLGASGGGGYAGVSATYPNGATGTAEVIWTQTSDGATAGPGPGGSASGALSPGVGGDGGLYGGGRGGGASAAGTSKQGIIVLIYTTSDYSLTPGPANLVLNGEVPSLNVAGNVSLAPPTASLNFTGRTATMTVPAVASPPAGALVLSGYVPTITTNSFYPPAGSLVLSGSAPSVNIAFGIAPGVGTLVMTGYAPVLSVNNTTIAPSTGQLILSGYVPLAVVPALASPSPAVLILTGGVPDLNINGMVTFSPPLVVMKFTGYAASLVIAPIPPVNFSPPPCPLVLTGYVPSVRVPRVPDGKTVLLSISPPDNYPPRQLSGISMSDTGVAFILAGTSVIDAATVQLQIIRPNATSYMVYIPDVFVGDDALNLLPVQFDRYLAKNTYAVYVTAYGELEYSGNWTINVFSQGLLFGTAKFLLPIG